MSTKRKPRITATLTIPVDSVINRGEATLQLPRHTPGLRYKVLYHSKWPFLTSQTRFLKSYLVLKETNRYSGLRQNACYHRYKRRCVIKVFDYANRINPQSDDQIPQRQGQSAQEALDQIMTITGPLNKTARQEYRGIFGRKGGINKANTLPVA
ncbi:hypothetical protein AFLA_000600 [Aspergillus flavus NRRL3357]|nr:hypothetical protein AFLA_000600 [Aspergillus flavus NRRL3357]